MTTWSAASVASGRPSNAPSAERSVGIGGLLLLLSGGVDAAFRYDEQGGDGDHRAADEQRFVPSTLVGEQRVCEETHAMDRTAVAD